MLRDRRKRRRDGGHTENKTKKNGDSSASPIDEKVRGDADKGKGNHFFDMDGC